MVDWIIRSLSHRCVVINNVGIKGRSLEDRLGNEIKSKQKICLENDVCLVYNVEDVGIETAIKSLVIPTIEGADPDVQIVVVRDYYNWIASRLKLSRQMPFLKINDKVKKKYVQHLSAAIDHLGDNLVYVNYNKWVADEEYRKKLAAELNLDVEAPLFKRLRLSSFGNIASPEKLNERWKLIKDDPEYQKILEESKDIINLSYQYFELDPFDLRTK